MDKQVDKKRKWEEVGDEKLSCPPSKRLKKDTQEKPSGNFSVSSVEQPSCSWSRDVNLGLHNCSCDETPIPAINWTVKDRISEFVHKKWLDISKTFSWDWTKGSVSKGGQCGELICMETFSVQKQAEELCSLPPSESRKSIRTDDEQERLSPVPMETNSNANGSQNQDVVTRVLINFLPNEVLVHIFSFLCVKDKIGIERVCKRWQDIGQNIPGSKPRKLYLKVAKRSLCFEYPYERSASAMDHLMPTLLSHCRRLRSLTVDQTNCSSWCSQSTFDQAGIYCNELTELVLLNVQLADTTSMRSIFQRCKKLRIVNANFFLTLKLLKLSILFEKDLMRIIKDSPLLESLQISARFNFATGKCFSLVNSKLSVLRLTNCLNLECVALENLMSRCRCITDVRLLECRKISETALGKFLENYKETLRMLYLDKWEHEVNWNKLTPFMTNLEELSLCSCYNINDEFCYNLAKNCKKLKVLRIRDTVVTDVGLCYLAPMTELIALNIGSLSLSGDGITLIASQARLEKLYANDIEDLNNADQCFVDVINLCPHLRLLDVSNTHAVTNNLVHAFCEAFNSGRLTGPMRLLVKNTFVTEDVERCGILELVFRDSCQVTESEQQQKQLWEKFTVAGPKYEYTVYTC